VFPYSTRYASIQAFEGGPDIDRYLAHSRAVLRTLGPAITRRLRQAGCELPDPQGGFYLFPNLTTLGDRLCSHGIFSGCQLCERLLEDTGVAALPSSDFGRPAGELSLRLA
jgi:aspartate aminotransferase